MLSQSHRHTWLIYSHNIWENGWGNLVGWPEHVHKVWYSALRLYWILISWFYGCVDPLPDPHPFLFLHFQTDKLIFGCVDANFGPPMTSTYQWSTVVRNQSIIVLLWSLIGQSPYSVFPPSCRDSKSWAGQDKTCHCFSTLARPIETLARLIQTHFTSPATGNITKIRLASYQNSMIIMYIKISRRHQASTFKKNSFVQRHLNFT